MERYYYGVGRGQGYGLTPYNVWDRPHNKVVSAQNVNGAAVEKPTPTERLLHLLHTCYTTIPLNLQDDTNPTKPTALPP